MFCVPMLAGKRPSHVDRVGTANIVFPANIGAENTEYPLAASQPIQMRPNAPNYGRQHHKVNIGAHQTIVEAKPKWPARPDTVETRQVDRNRVTPRTDFQKGRVRAHTHKHGEAIIAQEIQMEACSAKSGGQILI